MNRQHHITGQLPASALICYLFLLFIAGCKPFEPEQLMIIKTGNVSEVGVSTCFVQGEILDIGKSGITQHGFVWSDLPDPTIETAMFNQLGSASGPGIFEYQITGLTPSTIYHVRSYARGGGEVIFGDPKTFETMEGKIPTVETYPPIEDELTSYSAICGGEITDDGGSPVMQRGVCWSNHPGPTLEDEHTREGEGAAQFSSTMESLEPGTRYFVRAYATNQVGTGYGDQIDFVTVWDNTYVSDIEGNEYPTVQIGELVWTAMNIRSTKYSDGTPIPLVEEENDWAAMSDVFKAYCYYNNDHALGEMDGALYTWAAATNGHPGSNDVPSGVQGVCPAGWHLPSDEEWKMFEMILGMNEDEVNGFEYRGAGQGGKLKETVNWTEPNEGATNESGFNARPSGSRETIGRFGNYGTSTDYWTSTGSGEAAAFFRRLSSEAGEIFRSGEPVKKGFSVRCVKNY